MFAFVCFFCASTRINILRRVRIQQPPASNRGEVGPETSAGLVPLEGVVTARTIESTLSSLDTEAALATSRSRPDSNAVKLRRRGSEARPSPPMLAVAEAHQWKNRNKSRKDRYARLPHEHLLSQLDYRRLVSSTTYLYVSRGCFQQSRADPFRCF